MYGNYHGMPVGNPPGQFIMSVSAAITVELCV
jgi:hypothetical protein